MEQNRFNEAVKENEMLEEAMNKLMESSFELAKEMSLKTNHSPAERGFMKSFAMLTVAMLIMKK
jgi:hypothetical protein